MQKRTLMQLALALVALAAIAASSCSGALAADSPDTEIRYYRMTVFSGADANGTQVKVLAPQQDMSYPRNCTLYMVASNYGAGILEVRAGGQVLGTISPRDMTMITFSTPTGNNATLPLEFVLDGARLLVISYQLTSVSFDIYNEIDLPGLEELQADWRDRLNRERTLRERNETVVVEQDYLDRLEAAQEPIIISAVLGLIGIFLAFAVKWGSYIRDPLSGINYLVLIGGAVGLGILDLFTGVLKGQVWFYVPWASAYMITYYLYKLPEQSTATLDIKEHRLTIGKRLFYKDPTDGALCEAIQDWRAVLARWVRGDRCLVAANGTLQPDWTLNDLDSGEESPLLMVNSEKTKEAAPKPLETFKEKIMGVPGNSYRTLNLAKGGQFSHVDYMVNPDGWISVMTENQKLFQGLHRLMSSLPQLARALAEETVEYMHGYLPDEPTRLFRNFIARTIQMHPTALIESDIWEQYQQFRTNQDKLSELTKTVNKRIEDQGDLIPREMMRDPDRSAGHMGTAPGGGGNGSQ